MLQPRWTPKQPGTILEAVENPFGYPTDAQNQMDVMHYQEADACGKAYDKNVLAAQDYLNYFHNTWLVEYFSGRMIGKSGQMGDPDITPPQPPHALKILVAKNEDGSIKYDEVRVGPPVCAVPSYPKIPQPQSGSVGFNFGAATNQKPQIAVKGGGPYGGPHDPGR